MNYKSLFCKLKRAPLHITALCLISASCEKSTVPTTNGNASLSCVGDNCVAVGQYYQNGSPNGRPYIVRSENRGKTFDFLSEVSLPDDMIEEFDAQLYAVTCGVKTCAAVGAYNLDFSTFPNLSAWPVIILSNDSGKTFNTAFRPELPDDTNFNQITVFYGTAQSDDYLVSVGRYNFDVTALGGGTGKALIVVSEKDNPTVVKTFHPNLPSNSSDPSNSILSGVSCVKNHCVAVGSYTLSPNNIPIPLVLLSDDGGLNFNEFSQVSISSLVKMNSSTLPLDPSTLGLSLQSVTCENKHCVAVGYNYQTDIEGRVPLVMLSDDGGKTFSMKSSILMPVDTNNTLLATLKTISCDGLRCVAGGLYNFNLATFEGKALSLFSADGGLSFTSAPQVPLPLDSNRTAILTGASCRDGDCIAVGLYDLHPVGPGVNAALPLAVFSENNMLQFMSASQPILESDANLNQINALGNINP